MQSLKLKSAIFLYQQMIALKKLRKILFISSKSFFLFSRYSDFNISHMSSFSLFQPLLEKIIEIKFKVDDIIN